MFTITFQYDYKQIKKYSINKQYYLNKYVDRVNVSYFMHERFYK